MTRKGSASPFPNEFASPPSWSSQTGSGRRGFRLRRYAEGTPDRSSSRGRPLSEGVDRLRQLEDLLREIEELLVLQVLLLDGLPLLVGNHLTLSIGAVLADHHECREEDRLERDDHLSRPNG